MCILPGSFLVSKILYQLHCFCFGLDVIGDLYPALVVVGSWNRRRGECLLLFCQILELLINLGQLGLQFLLFVLLQLTNPRYLVPVFVDLSLENTDIFILLGWNLRIELLLCWSLTFCANMIAFSTLCSVYLLTYFLPFVIGDFGQYFLRNWFLWFTREVAVVSCIKSSIIWIHQSDIRI